VAELAEARKALIMQLAKAEQQIKNVEESANRMKANFEKKLQDKDDEMKAANSTISQVANIVHDMATNFFGKLSTQS
jgi:predicted  nucleic acid-binding Zn-ribbon protein